MFSRAELVRELEGSTRDAGGEEILGPEAIVKRNQKTSVPYCPLSKSTNTSLLLPPEPFGPISRSQRGNILILGKKIINYADRKKEKFSHFSCVFATNIPLRKGFSSMFVKQKFKRR